MGGKEMKNAVKRRWKGLAFAVLTLVILSLLLPLLFLVGVQNRSPHGFLSEELSPPGINSRREDVPGRETREGDLTRIVDRLESDFRPFLPERVENTQREIDEDIQMEDQMGTESVRGDVKGNPTPKVKTEVDDSSALSRGINMITNINESTLLCQLQYGSYCLWSLKNKVKKKNHVIRKIKDQLFVARAYHPIIDRMNGQEAFALEVKQNANEHEHLLTDAMVDAELPSHVETRIQKMEELISRGKSLISDNLYIEKKMRLILDWAEEEAKLYSKQGSFLYQLSVQTVAKSLHCLSMRLTVESFKTLPLESLNSHAKKLGNPDLQHYVIFSKNILASSVVINSTVARTEKSENLVFHLFTDSQNYFPMKFWFSRYSYKDATIDIRNIEEYGLQNPHDFVMEPHLSMFEEFRILIRENGQPRIEHISVFGHVHFLISDLLKDLRKVVVLDDDIVVQKDLSPLWDVELNGKVVGAVEHCEVQLGHLSGMHGQTKYDKSACIWASGVNVVDLVKWRELNLTLRYTQLLHEVMNLREKTATSWRDAVLPTSMLTFQDLVQPLDRYWVVSGLGADYQIRNEDIQKAVVLHYNGNMKPWLELGVQRYKPYWKNFLVREDPFMIDCNVNL